MKRYLPFILLLAVPAFSQTVTLTPSLAAGTGVTPILTWTSAPAGAVCTASGDAAWTGTKSSSGTQTLAKITTSKTYILTCTWPGDTTATLTWTEPTTNTDGSALTNLASYKIYRSTDQTMVGSPTSMVKTVTAPAVTTTLTGLTAGTHYFGLTAANTLGVESAMTNIVSKAITTGATVSDSASIQFPNSTILTVK